MYSTQMLIAGQPAPMHGPAFERANPASGKPVNRLTGASPADASAAADAAAAAFAPWSRTGPGMRRDLLLRAEQLMHAREEAIVAAMQAELGAAIGWARFNIHVATGILRECAALTTAITGRTLPSDIPGLTAMTHRRPCGVILSIAPWNGPVILAARAIAMPLACGNTVVLKGSELCPQTHRLVVDCFIDAGLPAGVLNYVVNAPEDAAAVVVTLIAHPAVRRVNFTGSSHVGRIIAEQAGRHLKPCLLELGGKSPLIVLEDADIEEAAHAACFGAFINSGQVCMATDRILVDERVADRFVASLRQRAAALSVGDGRHAQLGPLAMAGAADRLADLVAEAVALGAQCVLQAPRDGQIFGPVILDRVTPAMRIYHEESFGPIAPISRFTTVEQAIAMANDSPYGLAASVFGRDIGRALALASQLDAGNRHINMATVHDQPHMPFGGLKDSGYGRFNGPEAIAEFTDTCLTTLRTEPAAHYPF
ncbi:MAG TPA: aldehyde dehydrogenase [Novosphingobium sp.]|nr:aldehyde dehydrogenase [Novosphingobium sp.]